MEYKQLIASISAYGNFKKDCMADKLSQAYLFVCEDGLTAAEFVKEIARLIVCEQKNACGVCGHCVKANAGTHPDIMMYPKGKSFAVLDASDIYNNVQIKPMLASKKVFVINQIDNSTEQAQNKMLKIIEEPPANVMFLLTAQNENKVLGTIKSRVQKITIGKIDKKLLKNLINTENIAAEIAISNGDGYLGKTLEIAGNEGYLNIYKNVKNIILNLKNSSEIPAYSKLISENSEIFNNSLMIFNDFFRDILMLKLNMPSLIKNSNLVVEFGNVLEQYSVLALVEILKRLNGVKKKLDSNVNLALLADNMLLEILEVKFLCK